MKTVFTKLSLLLLLFIFHTSSFAQEIEVHIGNETKSNRKERLIKVNHTDEGLIILKRRVRLIGSNDYFIEVFDKKMNFVSRNELEFPDKDLEFSHMSFLNGEIYLFMQNYDKKSKVNTVYGTTISKSGEFKKDIYEIVKYETEKRRKVNTFDVFLSADSSYFMIKTTPPTLDKDQMASRHYLIIDHDFQEVDNLKINFPFKERDFSVNRSYLDPKGNLHMLCSVAIEESKRNTIFRTQSETEARIFTLYKGESDVKEYKINFENDDAGFISQIKMKTDKLGRLQCAGFYSDKKGNSTKGVFVFTIDPDTKEIANVSSQAFEDEYLNQFLSDRQIRRKKRKKKRNAKKNPFERLYHYKIRDIKMKKGGGFYMIAEYYVHTVTTTTDANGNTRTTDHYHYNDLMVISVLKDNSVDWYARVPKRQYSTNDGGIYSGIVTGLNDDNSLNIIFNDHRDNASELNPEKLRNLKLRKSKVVLVKFEKDGTATKTSLFGKKRAKVHLVPSASPDGRENDLILYSKGRRKDKFTNIILR